MFTIDPYYDVQRYNESLEALKNNNVSFNEFINIKPPYNWYIEANQNPIIMNYDLLNNSQQRFVVPKVKALRPNEEYKLFRRNDSRNGNIAKYINNLPLQEAEASEFACFFQLKSFNSAIQLSKLYPLKLWYFGKYYNNRYRVFLASHESLLAYLPQNNILLKKDLTNYKEFKETGRFEAELNYRIFLRKDYLKKYLETPYFYNGEFHKPAIINDMDIIL